MKNIRDYRGFTILELMIVMGIFSVLTGFVIANYNNLSQDSKLSQQAEKILDSIELARKKAISGESNSSAACTANPPAGFTGYLFGISTSSGAGSTTTYQVSMCCTPLASCSSAVVGSRFPIYSQTLEPPTQLSVVGTTYITFQKIDGQLTGVPFTLKNGNKCINFTVSSRGYVEKGAAYSC